MDSLFGTKRNPEKHFRFLLIGVLFFIAAGFNLADARQPLKTTLTYHNDQQLDFWRPAQKSPVAVFIHGGGWRKGTRRHGRVLAKPLLNSGFAFASVDYRTVPTTNVEGSLSDVEQAIRYLIENADTLNVDPDQIAIIGHSTGAHLAALTALRSQYRSRIKRALLLDGIAYDLKVQLQLMPRLKKLFKPEDMATLSPVELVDQAADETRFLILYTNARRDTVPAATALSKALGERAGTVYYPDVKHGAFLKDWKHDSAIRTESLKFLGNGFQ